MMRTGLFLVALLVLVGCESKPAQPEVKPMIARFFLENRPGETGTPLQLPVSGVRVAVNPKPVLVETDVAAAEVVRVDLGWCLLFRFTPAAARDFYRMSVAAQGRRLLLTLNGQPAGVRRLDQAISNGSLLIFIEVPDGNLPEVAQRVSATSASLAQHAPKK